MIQHVIAEEETVSVFIPSECVVVNERQFRPRGDLVGRIQIETIIRKKLSFKCEIRIGHDEHDIMGPCFEEESLPLEERFITYLLRRVELFSGLSESKFPLDLTSVVISAHEETWPEELSYHMNEWLASFLCANFGLLLVVCKSAEQITATLVTTFAPNGEQHNFPFTFPACNGDVTSRVRSHFAQYLGNLPL